MEAQVDGSECVDARWLRPADALDAGERGELMLVFPTIKHLQALAEVGSVADTLEKARTREVVPVQPARGRCATGRPRCCCRENPATSRGKSATSGAGRLF